MNSTINYFFNQSERPIYKWTHYLEIYDKVFQKFQNTECKVLEIGVYQGGSLQMWKNFFGKKSTIIGFDIDERCKNFEENQIHIRIGNQKSINDLENLVKEFKNFDVIIDDGSHFSQDQITTFKFLFEHLNNDGIYLVEDIHTSYWETHEGGIKKENSFVEFSKNKIDEINGYHNKIINFYTKNLKSISFYDSMIFFEKKINIKEPFVYESMNGVLKTWKIN